MIFTFTFISIFVLIFILIFTFTFIFILRYSSSWRTGSGHMGTGLPYKTSKYTAAGLNGTGKTGTERGRGP